jgi:phosphoglucomutase
LKNPEALLEKAKKGFATLEVSEKYIQSTLGHLKSWLTDGMFKGYVAQIAYLLEAEKWDFLLDSFYQVIPFGTGGRRGLVGIGPNRINIWTIQASAQGHSQYLIQQFGDEAKQRGVVLTFDVRKYIQKGVYDDLLPNPVMGLDGKQLAEAAATVYAANGIKVHMFDSYRSTPELSFAIRHLKAITGDMFSASHNLPTDNGKKVYDQFGGQLIPPYDQILVDEVTGNVKDINMMDFDEAKDKGLVQYHGEEIDCAYHDTVCGVSLSDGRNIKIVYSPLHGTGRTSVYPVLQKSGFDVSLDPKTSNLSGAFENVTFNIPNPEVVESFEASLPSAEENHADILISTDPDADRIGVMVNHNGAFRFLTGNEIGILLTQYAISKYQSIGQLGLDSTIIKTAVTTSLIEKIAQDNNIQCIGDLLVGFKYIGDIMNRLEEDNKMESFILGAEESHGFIMGNYCRDKDAASAAVWISEHAAELKKDNKTLIDRLDEIYAQYGYCHNYLTEIRLLGATGMEQIKHIMEHLRNSDVKFFGEFVVNDKADRWQGQPQPHLSKTDTASRDVLIYHFENVPKTAGTKVTIRPSGTEPKIKMYFEVIGEPFQLENTETEKSDIVAIRLKLESAFMQYCYHLIGVDFPDRGFLLFWQLPLNDKLRYFEIEDRLVNIKELPDRSKRKDELDKLLNFLGANPIEKVDEAFKAKYQAGIREYLDLAE